MRVNFRIWQRSHAKAMFLRTLLAVLLGVFVSAVGFAAHAAPAAAECDQMSTQQEDGSGDCGGGMADAACEIHCATGVIIASAIPAPVAGVSTQPPSMAAASAAHDFGHAPEKAPPKIASR